MARKPLVVANWKMNHTRVAARDWCAQFRDALAGSTPAAQVAVAPSFLALDTVRDAAGGAVLLAAQDVHWEPAGAFTGEVSPEMLADVGCRMVIVGHSERRQHFGETDQRIARKVAAVADCGMVPILCVGETEIQRESGRTEAILEGHLRAGLGQLGALQGGRGHGPVPVVLAYEPVWAIGTGKVAQPEQVEEAHGFLRGILASIAGREHAEQVRILYGGSVNPANVAPLAALPEVDGFLVGGASLDAASFHRIVIAFG
ncbi:MAG: triose-phosphate isomerase [Acidobacteria bacterium]|nr:triose-phosphate isomerase [Acidobacteriota bacterium]